MAEDSVLVGIGDIIEAGIIDHIKEPLAGRAVGVAGSGHRNGSGDIGFVGVPFVGDRGIGRDRVDRGAVGIVFVQEKTAALDDFRRSGWRAVATSAKYGVSMENRAIVSSGIRIAEEILHRDRRR